MKQITSWIILVFVLITNYQLFAQRAISPEDTTFCAKGTATFKVTPDVDDQSYQWEKRKIGETNWEIIDGAILYTHDAEDVPPPGEEYHVIITTTSGPIVSDIAKMTVVPPPTQVNFTGDFTKCEGTATLITVNNTPFDIAWSGPNGSSLGNSNAISVVVPGIYTATISFANSMDCTLSGNITIVDNPLPNASISASPTGAVCDNTPVVLSETGGNATNWSWIGPGGALNSGKTWLLNSPQNGDYSVTVTDINNCQSSTSTIINILPAPQAEILPVGQTYLDVCSGVGLPLGVSGGTFTGWNWAGPGTFDNYSSPTPYVTNPQSGQYAVTVTGTNGCTSVATKAAVYPPGLDVTILPAQPTICNGETIAIHPGNTQLNGYSYLWNDGTTTWALTTSEVGTYTVTITETQNGCTATHTTNVKILSQSDIVISGPATVCHNTANAVYQLEGGSFDSWSWEVQGGTNHEPSSHKAFANVTWDESSPSLWVKVTVNVGACSVSKTINVDLISDAEALPNGVIILKPSNDILIFANDTSVYKDSLKYDWGALIVSDAANGVVDNFPLPETITGVKINNDKQYYYIDTVNPNLIYYVKISRAAGDGCETICYWPGSPFEKLGSPDTPPVIPPASAVNSRVIPNPNSGDFSVQLPGIFDGEVAYQLYYATGAIATNGYTSVASGIGWLDFRPDHFPPGLYYLSVLKEGFGLQTNLKVIIQ